MVMSYNVLFFSFINLVVKTSLMVERISKCRENGIDRLRNGQLRRRCSISFRSLSDCLGYFLFMFSVLADRPLK